MAPIENRSHHQVTVKNRDDLMKTFLHNQVIKAEAYCQLLQSPKFKPKLSRLDNHFIVRVREKGVAEKVLHANSLEQAEQIKMKLKVEHGQGLFVDYFKGQNTTLAQAMLHYLWEVAPRNKSFEIEAY